MKKIILAALFITSTYAQVGLPSFSNSDFDALEQTANDNAVEAALDYADMVGVRLTGLSKVKRSQYQATTSTSCTFTVKVGLLFKANVISQYNCQ